MTSELNSNFKALNAPQSSAALSTAKINHVVDGTCNNSSIFSGDDGSKNKSGVKRNLMDSSLQEKRKSFFDVRKKTK